ncbi:hypothetical protein B7494_g126 [Chlorociboria aeruginascens]|nr:hypothetical protein B7494_g126 [Chlorociboria aeruginascens]
MFSSSTDKEAVPPVPRPPPINNDRAHALPPLQTGAAAIPSSQTNSPNVASDLTRQRNYQSSPTTKAPPRSPLRRTPSSMSLDARSPTPSLHRKASMNSLHGVGGVTPTRGSTPRRVSSAQVSSMPEETKAAPPRHTPVSIAKAHFEAELELQDTEEESRSADTIVILHDACYGHRFSRPRTSRASLSTIVERPERIQASILGLSVAYVRLGDRHAEGLYALHPQKHPSTIPSTPFRIRKTTRTLPLLSQAVTNVHGTKWMEELKIMCSNAEAKLAMNGKELIRPEMNRGPEQGAPDKLHEGDLYLCAESLEAMEGALGAVCEGVDAVFHGSANGKGPHRTFVAIRPPGHHCSASYPSGFCWLNNVHVGVAHAALTHGLTHAAIIDFDLHHGDGSQAIAWEHNSRATNLPKNAAAWKKTSIGYFSLHDINSYPCEMGDEEKIKNASLCIENAHGQSIWNVHLQPWKSEIEFWDLYENKYSILLEKTRNYLRTQTERLRSSPNLPNPKAAIFISAGFDASEWESSGMQRHKVNVPTEFYARLTQDVVKIAAEEGTSVNGRIISVLEGGYSDRALCSGVFSHVSGLAGGDPVATKTEAEHNGLGYEMGRKIGALNGQGKEPVQSSTPLRSYNPSWWSIQHLEKLDALVNPPQPPPEPKRPRDATPPTYSTPTQSFIAKVQSPKIQRSTSNLSAMGNGSSKLVSRPPSPPPPDVDWTVAAHELSKLLIPTDRQTMSCKPEDLSTEATRARRDRQSTISPPTSVLGSEPELSNTRMALRVRKPVKATIDTVEEDESKKPNAKTNRRKTVAGAAVLATEKAISRSKPAPTYSNPTTQSSRRLSLASTTGSVNSDRTSRANGHSRVPSNGEASMQRPGSSQSIRPDSSMSSRGHSIPPITVKKTRAPSQPRNDPSKPSRIRRKSPLSERAVSSTTDGHTDPQSRSNSLTAPDPTPNTSDMDSLTAGMKKIKINLTTKAQREAREKEKTMPKETTTTTTTLKPAAIKSAARPTKKPADNIPAPPSSNMLPPATEQPIQTLPPHPSTPKVPLLPLIPTQLHEPTQVPLPASSPLAPTFQPPPAPVQQAPTNSMSNIFIPYQPEGPPPSTQTQHAQLHWLPPNAATPTPVRQSLPVFTSTSAIPFGINSGMNQDVPIVKEEEKSSVTRMQNDVWEVPEAPQK